MVQKSLVKEKGILRVNGINAGDIINILRDKHIKDVFVEECKNGETWGARDLYKIDAWVLKRTYSPLTTIGYEVKTSRQDFEQDQKWTNYLDLCHQFFFVCPAGLIRAEDLPNDIGIIWVSKNAKLHMKRKAKRKEPDYIKLCRLLIYIVMARSRITTNMFDSGDEPIDKLQIIRDEVEKSKERKELAYFVTGHVREMYEYAKGIDISLQSRERDIERFEEKLARLDIIWDSKSEGWFQRNKIDNEIQMLGKQVDDRTLQDMERVANQLNSAVIKIRGYRNKK